MKNTPDNNEMKLRHGENGASLLILVFCGRKGGAHVQFAMILLGAVLPSIGAAPVVARTVFAAESADARAVVSSALDRARTERKAVFVHFTGARCTGCQHLDSLLESEPIRSIMAEAFVTVRLTIADPDKSRVTPRAFEMLKAWARNACVPFYAVLSSDGRRVGDGCGFPGTAEETDAFLLALGRGAPQLSDTRRSELRHAVKHAVGEVVRGLDGSVSWAYFRTQYRANATAATVMGVLGLLSSWLAWHRYSQRARRRTTRCS